MPIDNRKVLQNIRTHEVVSESGVVITPRRVLEEKDADEIVAMFDQKQLDAFVQNGVLEGDWKSTKAEASVSEAEAAGKTETKKGK